MGENGAKLRRLFFSKLNRIICKNLRNSAGDIEYLNNNANMHDEWWSCFHVVIEIAALIANGNRAKRWENIRFYGNVRKKRGKRRIFRYRAPKNVSTFVVRDPPYWCFCLFFWGKGGDIVVNLRDAGPR